MENSMEPAGNEASELQDVTSASEVSKRAACVLTRSISTTFPGHGRSPLHVPTLGCGFRRFRRR